MAKLKLKTVTPVIRDGGKLNLIAVDENGDLWNGFTTPNSDKYMWERIEGPDDGKPERDPAKRLGL